MELIDTHSHIYLPQFDSDRDEVVARAKGSGVKQIYLPNIDSASVKPMLELCDKHPDTCFPMIGLHPTSVNENYENELTQIEAHLKNRTFIAMGECGIDLYWDKTFLVQQKVVFRYHIMLAKKHGLPLVIHARESFNEILEILEQEWESSLKGVFHSFTGTRHDMERINKLGFYFGIGGILTYKNSGLQEIIKNISLDRILLETDSPYLAPAPMRGKRNESSFLAHTAQKMAELLMIPVEEVARATSLNARQLFNQP